MPADERYDAVHPATVAGEFYECKDREPFKPWYWVPDGYQVITHPVNNEPNSAAVVTVLTRVPNVFTQHCIPPDGPAADRCGNCKWKTNQPVKEETK